MQANSDLEVEFSDVAVLLPCLNEAGAVADVIREFKTSLPGCQIYVFDNDSTDNTVQVARESGAIVRSESMRGKGHVVRRMFRDVEAEIFVLADGDLTYDATAAPMMVRALRDDQLDVVLGVRINAEKEAYRRGHRFGNAILTGAISRIFKASIADMLSGYRVMSRRFVKSFAIDTQGFEIETEMTVHMLQVEAPFREMECYYRVRGADTESKLRTYTDGTKILWTIINLAILERPMRVFGLFGLVSIIVSLAMFISVWIEFQQTGFVGRFPTLIVSVVLGLTGLVSIFTGLILSAITRTRRDMKRLAFLSFKVVSDR